MPVDSIFVQTQFEKKSEDPLTTPLVTAVHSLWTSVESASSGSAIRSGQTIHDRVSPSYHHMKLRDFFR